MKTNGVENKFGKKLNDIELQSITSGTDATYTSCESITNEGDCVAVSTARCTERI